MLTQIPAMGIKLTFFLPGHAAHAQFNKGSLPSKGHAFLFHFFPYPLTFRLAFNVTTVVDFVKTIGWLI